MHLIASEPGEIYRLVFLGSSPNGPAEKPKCPSLFIVARDDARGDGPRLPEIRAKYEKAPDPKKLILLEGSAHAQFLFDTDQGERVKREILEMTTQMVAEQVRGLSPAQLEYKASPDRRRIREVVSHLAVAEPDYSRGVEKSVNAAPDMNHKKSVNNTNVGAVVLPILLAFPSEWPAVFAFSGRQSSSGLPTMRQETGGYKHIVMLCPRLKRTCSGRPDRVLRDGEPVLRRNSGFSRRHKGVYVCNGDTLRWDNRLKLPSPFIWRATPLSTLAPTSVTAAPGRLSSFYPILRRRATFPRDTFPRDRKYGAAWVCDLISTRAN